MNRIFSMSSVFSIALLALFSTSCKKSSDSAPSYKCTACTTTPEANAAHDNSSKGIYKGIIVGSSGTIKFDIMNNDSTIKAYMVIDGVSDTLTASVGWVSGTSYVSPFTGTLNGQPVSITMSIDANGGNPIITAMSIPGHPNAALEVSKETSSNLIKCFEGMAYNQTNGDSATFDLVLSTSLSKWTAKVKSHGGTSTSTVEGTFSGSTLSFNDGHGASGSATLSGDNIINGTWVNPEPENGTWNAKRTL